jgi:hypothetical protein
MPTTISGSTGVSQIQDGVVTNADIDTVAASKLTGALPAISAANLTAIPAANITGTLPAISGANLTGITSQGRNLFINGGFDVWQRGTSLAAATSYLADRWWNATTETQTRQTFTVGQTDVPHNPTYYHRGTSGSTEWYGLKQCIEDVGITAGREVTLSYWAKGSSAFTNAPFRGQNFGNSGSSEVNAALSTASITTSWARYTHTFTWPSISGKTVGANNFIRINLIRANVNNVTIDLANCQLEFGDTATDFEQRSYGEELALCQRYYQYGTTSATYCGFSNGSSQVYFTVPLTTPLRTSPTLSRSGSGTKTWTAVKHNGNNGSSTEPLVVTYVEGAFDIACRQTNHSGLSDMYATNIYASSFYIIFDAEL